MNLGILEDKGLQLLCGCQYVGSSFSILINIFQIFKQVLDGCNSILSVSVKQSICYRRSHFIPEGTKPYLIHVVSSESLFT